MRSKTSHCIIFGLVAVISLMFASIASAEMQEDITLHKSCAHCGMNREAFDFSRMLIEYNDGSAVPVCSLHCAAIDLANNIDKAPRSIKVGDFKGKQLIDAEQAFWVAGGNKPGVMSKRGKWAFGTKDEAENFIKTNGGKLVSFEDAIKMAYDDMYEDTRMIREKRKMMRMKQMDKKS
jgi:copper chaperone NosL